MIQVATGVVVNAEKKILVALRPPHVHQGNLWEFPGGKLDPGETVEQALARELEEEIGIIVLSSRHLICVKHRYPEMDVQLNVHWIDAFEGEPFGKEGQVVKWVTLAELVTLSVPAATAPVVTHITQVVNLNATS